MSDLCRTNIVVQNLQTHEPMQMLCGNLSSIYLLHIRFNLRTVVAALVVVYGTDSSSIEAGRFLSTPLPCRGIWRITAAPWTMAQQNLGYGAAEPVGYGAVFEIISLDYVRFRNSQRMIQTDGIT